MDKKELREKRMQSYFIKAAKEIMKEEGIKGLSARKVGEKAGYSYATIYNYFHDINELVTYCVFELLEDCYRYMIALKIEEKDSKEKLILYAKAYFQYLSDNPDLFHLIFVENLKKVPSEIIHDRMIPSVDNLLKQTLSDCVSCGYIEEANVDLLGDLITSSIHGKLLFYVKGRQNENRGQILNTIQKEIEYLLVHT